MSVRQVLRMGHPQLMKPSQDIIDFSSPSLKEWIQDMKDTMEAEGGVGIADIDGHVLQGEATGFHARVIQHEYDHLQGILYPSRIRNFQYFGFEAALANNI